MADFLSGCNSFGFGSTDTLGLLLLVCPNIVFTEVWNLIRYRQAAFTASSSSLASAGVTSSIYRTGTPKLGAVKTYQNIFVPMSRNNHAPPKARHLF